MKTTTKLSTADSTLVLNVLGDDMIRAAAALDLAMATYDGDLADRALGTYRGACETLQSLGLTIDAALAAAR